MKKKFILQILMLFVFIFSFFVIVDEAMAEECLSYEPAEVRLIGTIIRKTFPGPPNYESIERGDEPETYWILRLAKPICINGDTADEINNATVNDVKVLQLVFLGEDDEYSRYRNFLSKKVVVTGTLFLGHTGHHHTDILINVKDIRPFTAKNKTREK